MPNWLLAVCPGRLRAGGPSVGDSDSAEIPFKWYDDTEELPLVPRPAHIAELLAGKLAVAVKELAPHAVARQRLDGQAPSHRMRR